MRTDGLFCSVTDQTELSEQSSSHYRVDHHRAEGGEEGGGVTGVTGRPDGRKTAGETGTRDEGDVTTEGHVNTPASKYRVSRPITSV